MNAQNFNTAQLVEILFESNEPAARQNALHELSCKGYTEFGIKVHRREYREMINRERPSSGLAA